MTGCESWVFQTILDVVSLKAWKSDVTESGTLNVVELAEKSAKIQTDIQNRQADLQIDYVTYASQDIQQITEVYAHATEVFLHTTTSGAYPDVSNIRDAVSRAVAAIQRLNHPQLLRNLSWPICVAASMAGPEHEKFFSAIEEGARGDGEYGFKLTRALMIAKECQRLRRTSTLAASVQERRVYDWYDSMRSLGQEWYLL